MNEHLKRATAWIAAALALLVAGAVVVITADEGSPRRLTDRADRVLVISLPYTTWSDLEGPDLPNIDRLLARSSIASLTTRTTSPTDLIDGYVTVGAGTRATGGTVPTDGAAFGVDEMFGRDRAGDVYERQTGNDAPRNGIVHLGLGEIQKTNEEENLDALVGALGHALHEAGFSRAVIANADGGSRFSTFPEYQRLAVAALMGPSGQVPAGRVDAELLTDDPEFPFGRRLDVAEVGIAFADVWDDQSVVLVEASDVVRATRYAPFAIQGQRRFLYKEALRASDLLVGRLLEEVDPTRDAVVVVSPGPSALGETLSVVSVRAPGVEPGLLRSPSLRRPGFVQIVDVAPMILDLVGAERPTEINGRPMTIEDTKLGGSARRAFLIDEIDTADFRDSVVNPVIITFVVLEALLALGAVLVLRGRASPATQARVRFGAIALLAFIPVVYLARLIPFHEFAPAYPIFLIVATLALTYGCRALGRGHELDPPIIGLALIFVVLAGDVLLGAHLQLNSAFGYTPTVGVRISGFGNISYAALAAAAVLLAGLVAHRVPGRRGVHLAIGILALALVADAAPFWGADVGGVLSMVPAFGITAALLLGITVRWRWRTVLLCLGAVVIGVAVAAALDLSQPEAQRTHLGRFIEQVRDEGFSQVTGTVAHKVSQNLGTITSIWGLMLPGVLAFLVYVKFVSKRLTPLMDRVPELRSALVGFTILAVIGYVVNDSGINVPAMMLSILNATLIALLVTVDTSTGRARTTSKSAKKVRAAR